MKTLLTLALTFAVTPVILPTVVHAKDAPTATVCIGERIEECISRFGRSSFNTAPGCNVDRNLFQSLCMFTGSGTKVDFYTQPRTPQPGHQCGYTLVDIYCQWNMPLPK